jgi:putative endonuclease
MYFVYIIECKDKSLYTGITNDVERRFRQHKEGKGARYTGAKKVKKLRYSEAHPSRSSALKREAEIKSWRREAKLTLIASKR